ncbi:MAG: shikimate dehydrogenase [Ruminococcaceae bacterium]|nr:shikimate dehydrogenase [Oscillospiraceae bacterium]
MTKYGLCGEKLGHSFSPIIHKMLGNDDYSLFAMTREGFLSFMKEKNFSAVNVTIPYKQDALSACGEVSEEAKNIGSVNTVVNKNGTLYGYNTDIYGFTFMLENAGIQIAGKKVLVLGTGGTSLTAVSACKMLAASEIITVSRKGDVNYENVYDIKDAEIIINTTPVGMYPSNGISPVDISRFEKLCGVADVIYNPQKTKLILDAEKRGLKTAGGLSMLVAQAVEADRLFFSREKSDDDIIKIQKILDHLNFQVSNIVLVGMPGCGKSTVGKIVSEKLGRKFVDADDYITEKYRRTPADIIKADGEEEFRRIETEALRDITKLSSCVISCGGGAVIKEENRDLIKQNGVCFYITRDIEKLATYGRPLSSGGIDSLKKLFEIREPLYKMTADFEIPPCESAKDCADMIIERFVK